MSRDDPYRFEASTRTAQELGYVDGLDRLLKDSSYSQVERMMNFALYTPRQDLARFLVKHEIFKRVLDVQGSVVECGVFFGGGLMTWAQLSAIYEPVNHQRRVIGFDTFEGFPDVTDADSGATSAEAHPGGLAIDSHAEITRAAELFDMNRSIGHIPKVELVRGDATQTIPRYVDAHPHLLISLLYLDFDIYDPTVVALEQLLPRMPKGAVIAFDELNLPDWPGETVALREVIDIQGLKLERLPFGSTICFAQIDGPVRGATRSQPVP
ncbi:MAG: TylF/MycF/NovP-related O-methyltransferase [Solirubrobacteraceae bacterium]